MTRAAAVLLVLAALIATSAAAHPGHRAMEGHLHGWGLEHAVLIAAVVGFILYAFKKK